MKDFLVKNKLKIVLIPIIILGLIIILKPSPEKQIKKTISEYWNCFENNQFNKSVELFHEGDISYGLMSMEFHKLKKNYPHIKSQITPIDKILIKDTIVFGTKRKFVNYTFLNKNSKIKPMKMTFIFWKEIGYDKIQNPNYLDNFLDWDEK